MSLYFQWMLKLMLKYQQNSITPATASMQTLHSPTPDYQSHHKITLNNQQTQLTFRYFSPVKNQQQLTSNLANTNKVQRGSGGEASYWSDNESLIEKEITIIRGDVGTKVVHEPERMSDKFYEQNLGEVRFCTLEYFQEFQRKLLKRVNGEVKEKTIRLKLTSKSKQQQNQPKTKRSYIKRVQISLANQQNTLKSVPAQNIPRKQPIDKTKTHTRLSHFQRTGNRGPVTNNNIVIRLYDEKPSKTNREYHTSEQKNFQNEFMTPTRNASSRKKGITVYSSTSTRKQSLRQEDYVVKTQNNCNISIHNISTNPIEKQPQSQPQPHPQIRPNNPNKSQTRTKSRPSLKQRYGQQFVSQLKRKTQKIKKRVFSKSKLGSKENPVRGIVPSSRKKIN